MRKRRLGCWVEIHSGRKTTIKSIEVFVSLTHSTDVEEFYLALFIDIDKIWI